MIKKNEKELIAALKKFYGSKGKNKLFNVAIKLKTSGDLSPEAFDELSDYIVGGSKKKEETRAKTVTPDPEWADPKQYDKCGNLMTKDEVVRRDEMIARRKKEREEEEKRYQERRNRPSYDPCGGGGRQSFC